MSSRTPVGGTGRQWARELPGTSGSTWRAAVWVRDLDGRRRLVQARGASRRAAERSLAERLRTRLSPGLGAHPEMTVAQLGGYWMRRRRDELRATEQRSSEGGRGSVSAQTLAGYQHALSRVVNPHLGALRLSEARPGVLDEVLARIDGRGRSTRIARSVLGQMFAMAVRHDAVAVNPMREVRRPPRRRRPVHALSVPQARSLLTLTAGHQHQRADTDLRRGQLGRRRLAPDLHDLVVLLLASGMRIGEALALTWADVELDAAVPWMRVAATLVEPRRDAATQQVFVRTLHRQPTTKTGSVRAVALPDAAIAVLVRRARSAPDRSRIFTSATGGWLWPNNQRTRLRAIVRDTPFRGVTPHTLRRTVATVVAREMGVSVARDLLGHQDPSITARHYIAQTDAPIDARHVLDEFFTTPPGPLDR